jgi:hypothetical protein
LLGFAAVLAIITRTGLLMGLNGVGWHLEWQTKSNLEAGICATYDWYLKNVAQVDVNAIDSCN